MGSQCHEVRVVRGTQLCRFGQPLAFCYSKRPVMMSGLFMLPPLAELAWAQLASRVTLVPQPGP